MYLLGECTIFDKKRLPHSLPFFLSALLRQHLQFPSPDVAKVEPAELGGHVGEADAQVVVPLEHGAAEAVPPRVAISQLVEVAERMIALVLMEPGKR